MPKIKKGYYIKARSIMSSDIMRNPPHVREVWDWLLMNANHSPGKSSGVLINRGQLFTSLDEIRDGLSWYVGYRKMQYTKDHMKKAMKALKKASMVSTDVSTKGMLITICNYKAFQDPKNYESTNESTNESTSEAPMKHQCSTSIINKKKKKKNKDQDQDDFSIFDFLNSEHEAQAISDSGGKDFQLLGEQFNKWINSPKADIPNEPVKAFLSWCCRQSEIKSLSIGQTLPPVQKLSEREQYVSDLGFAHWNRTRGGFLDLDKKRLLEKYEKDTGKLVDWNNLKEWRAKYGKKKNT